MVQHILINAIQQIAWQRDVELLGLAQVLGDINVHQRPSAAGILGISRMQGDGVGWRNCRTVLGQNLEVPLNGLAGHRHGVVQIVACGEATGNIRHFNTPGVLVIAHGNRNRVKHIHRPPGTLRNGPAEAAPVAKY